jgi:glycosyltransferase involved in cell wall biosynthesis
LTGTPAGPDAADPDAASPDPAGPAPADGRVAAGLRVLVVTVVHDPEDARIRHRELTALLAAGATVTYAAPFTAYRRTPPDGVRGLDLPRARGRRRLPAVRAARLLIRREAGSHDVVLVHDPDLLLALAGLPSRRRGGPVRVWDVHEDTAAALGMRGWLPAPLRPLASLGVRLAETWAERRLELLLAEDSYTARFTRPHPVVPNSVLVPAAEPPPPGDDRVVYLGRVTVPRGALELVELGRLLVAGQVRLDVVGPADADCAEQLAAAHEAGWLHHHGFVPNSTALGLLGGALAGLSLLHDEPNYAHSRPTKIMEYMAHGVPVVTTPNAVSVELVQRYGCGVVVPFEDAAAAAKAVLQLRADPARRSELAAAGRASALADLDWRRDGRAFAAALAGWAAAPAWPARKAGGDAGRRG